MVQVPAEMIKALRDTYDHGTQAEISRVGVTDEQVAQFVRLLEHGVKQICGAPKRGEGAMRLRVQVDQVAVRFYMEDKG